MAQQGRIQNVKLLMLRNQDAHDVRLAQPGLAVVDWMSVSHGSSLDVLLKPDFHFISRE